jgi:nitrogenase-associated protein
MADVTFYGMPDCPANARQKKQLQAAGHTLSERDLSAEAFTADGLRLFFEDRPVDEWFNRRAAAVKSGEVKPDNLDEASALAAMLANRDLIRRPLLQVGTGRKAGFDPNALNAWIGLTAQTESCDDKHSRGVCDHGHHHMPKRS